MADRYRENIDSEYDRRAEEVTGRRAYESPVAFIDACLTRGTVVDYPDGGRAMSFEFEPWPDTAVPPMPTSQP